MKANRIIATLLLLVGGFVIAREYPVRSQTGSTAMVQCKERYYENLPGQNSLVLTKTRSGSFTAVTESYAKPRTYPNLKCRFHPKDGRIFSCETDGGALWGVDGQRLQSSGIDSEGNETNFDGYVFEVTKYPHGDDRETVVSLRFGKDKCTAGR